MLTHIMNYKGDCKTAPATPGLLNMMLSMAPTTFSRQLVLLLHYGHTLCLLWTHLHRFYQFIS